MSVHLGIDIGGTSIKAAAISGDGVAWTARSGTYARPSQERLREALAEATSQLSAPPATVGLCVPGRLDESRSAVVQSVNVPGLVGTPLAGLLEPLGCSRPPVVASDANATAYDIYISQKLTGRLLAIVIGTGVGAAVLDDGGRFLHVDGDSPGHLGQCDVSLEDPAPIGPDGGSGSLEAYLGVPALAARYGSTEIALQEMKATDPPIRALTRIIRIAHAIYRPAHVCLAGGLGIRLGHLLSALRAQVSNHLTNTANPDWTMSVAENDFHAAVGAARLAAV